jgi:hypothetical protein
LVFHGVRRIETGQNSCTRKPFQYEGWPLYPCPVPKGPASFCARRSVRLTLPAD